MGEYISYLNENLRATMVKKVPKFIGEQASFQDYVLKQLPRHNFDLLGKDGGKNHNPIRSW